ncbi:MAG TPA: hypothetical protein VJ986_02295 [Gaiellaceae bacterium]|nr:hypothetical protein [Gaiellaceae bacterium]
MLACVAAATVAAISAPRAAALQERPHHKALRFYSAEIHRFRVETWHWQRVMGIHTTPVRTRRLAAVNVTRLRHLGAVWRHRAQVVHRRAQHPPHLANWLCIHHYEGSWSDPGAPYYGGLQMDISFQRAYGPWLLQHKGTANHWTPLEQIWTAERGRRARGFYPWPNTARACGLL